MRTVHHDPCGSPTGLTHTIARLSTHGCCASVDIIHDPRVFQPLPAYETSVALAKVTKSNRKTVTAGRVRFAQISEAAPLMVRRHTGTGGHTA